MHILKSWPDRPVRGRFLAFWAPWAAALLVLAAAPNARPQSTSPEEELKFAEKLFEDGLYSIAAVQYRGFAERFPRDERAPLALFRAAEALSAEGDHREVLRVLQALEITYPKSEWNDEALVLAAESQLALGDTLAAVGALERLTYLYPSSPRVPEALSRSAELYLQLRKPQLARRRLGDLIDNYPDRPQRAEAYVLVGQAYLQEGELRAALIQFQKALETTGQAAVSAESMLLQGKVLEELGQVDEAESFYRKVIEGYPERKEAVHAKLRLGEIARQRGDYPTAQTLFEQVPLDSVDSAEAVQTLLWLGRVQMEQGSYAAALQTFSRGLERNPTGLAACRVAFGAATAAERLADPTSALSYYQRVADDTTLTGSLAEWRAQAHLEIARLQIDAGRPHQALASLARVIREFPQSAAAAEARFRRGQILAQRLHDFSEAIRALGRFVDDYPHNPRVDDAQYLIAQSYEQLQQLDVALAEYRRYLQRYPAAERVQEVRDRVRLLDRLVADQWQSRLAEVLASIPDAVQGGDGRHLSYQLGRLFFDLRDFPRAIHHFKRTLAQGYDAQDGAEALYYLGRSYYGLAQRQIFSGDGTNPDALIDSARVALAYVKDHFSDTDAAAEAAYLLLEWDLRQTVAADSQRILLEDALREWDEKYPQNAHRIDIAKGLADRLLAAVTPADTLVLSRIIDLYDAVVAAGRGADQVDAAMLGLARAHLLAGDTTAAVVRLDSLIARRARSPVGPQALMLRAEVAVARGKANVALALYDEVETAFFYSPFADTARVRKVALLLKRGRYGDVIQLAPQILGAERPGSLDRSYPDVLLALAAAYDSLGHEARAAETYLRFTRRFPGDPRKTQVLLALGRLAQRRQAFGLARSYYEEVLRVAPESTEAIKAELALADMAYARQDYQQARARYLALLKKSEAADVREHAAARAILCLYRQGAIEAADNEASSFKNQFPQAREQQAQFLYEKGEVYIRQKSFARAERVFKSLSKKYKGTEHAALGELGLGRIYLITTKPDEALDVLTRLVERYPNTRAAALALLNLGDFYRANGQVENALATLKRVVEHPKAGEAADTATRYLIQLYDQVNLNGKALALARRYLEAHPDDPQRENLQIKIGTLLMEEKDYESALTHFRRLKPLVQGEVETEVQYYIGEALMNLGRYQDAVLEFLKVEYLSPPSKLPWKVTAIYQAGIALMRLKKFDRAREMFRRIVLSHGATSDFGRIAQAKIEEIERELMSAADTPK